MSNDDDRESFSSEDFREAESRLDQGIRHHRPASYGKVVILTWLAQVLLFVAVGGVLIFSANAVLLLAAAAFVVGLTLVVQRLERRFRTVIPAGSEKYEALWNRCRKPAIVLIAIVMAFAFGTTNTSLNEGVGWWGLAIIAVGVVCTIPRLAFGISVLRGSERHGEN